jgi:hypothetical protein
MNRPELQRLAHERIDNATVLLAAGHWSAAFYIVGYAVECALKSCVLRHIHDTGAIFADPDYEVKKFRTHDFKQLVELAGLKIAVDIAQGTNPTFKLYWTVALRWNETSRYETKTEAQAREVYEAITEPTNGALAWIQQHW